MELQRGLDDIEHIKDHSIAKDLMELQHHQASQVLHRYHSIAKDLMELQQETL